MSPATSGGAGTPAGGGPEVGGTGGQILAGSGGVKWSGVLVAEQVADWVLASVDTLSDTFLNSCSAGGAAGMTEQVCHLVECHF